MIQKWFNTNAAAIADMTEMTDELTREWSEKEIEDLDQLDAPGLSISHIELPICVLNIHYLYGRTPFLPNILEMDRKTIESIVYCSKYMITDPEDPRYGTLIDTPDASALTGAAAIEALLKQKGVNTEHIILHCIPVLPYELRWADDKRVFPVQFLYARVFQRARRLRQLIDMQAPEIILRNESRMLQEYTDALISNGSRGLPVSNLYGIVLESLDEVYHCITDFSHKRTKMVLLETLPSTSANIKELVNKIPDDEEGDLDTELYESEILDPAYSVLLPLCEIIIHENFSAYESDFKDEMIAYANSGIKAAFGNFDGTDDYFAPAIYSHICCFIKKRVMFEEV